MKEKLELEKKNIKKILIIVCVIIVAIGISYGVYYSRSLYKKLQETRSDLFSVSVAFENKIKQLENDLVASQQENTNISAILTDAQKQNLDLQNEQDINKNQIDILTKLTTIDPELLRKYSKVYFLSENYIPVNLVNVDVVYSTDPNKKLQVLDKVDLFLENMLKDANDNNVHLLVQSAYRSFLEQKALKAGYKTIYGAGSNKFSADQGYSEHQIGTTLDFTTSETKGVLLSFAKTSAFTWMSENAYKYGFIISYPKTNTYYQYEPWHWRFVGRELATYLHDNNKYFYELDQRFINNYLIKIFD